jgi:UDP-glucose 4-epimerase
MTSPSAPIVLVTGAFGFVGRHAARAFAAQGSHVIGLGHGQWSKVAAAAWGVTTWLRDDVSDQALDALPQVPDMIIHCGGGSLVGPSFDDPRKDFLRTVGGTSAVLDYMRRRAPNARLVYPSSAAVYGTTGELPITINAPLRPVSPYGVHKLAAEALCRSYAQHFGVKVAIVRLFSLYGPGLRKQLLWDACGKLTKGIGTFAGTGLEVRDWLHVEDAVALLAAAAEVASPSCPIANGGTGTGTPVKDIVTALAERLAPGIPIIFTGSGRTGDPPAYIADVGDAKAWGWEPKLSWREGVKTYAEWYCSETAAVGRAAVSASRLG